MEAKAYPAKLYMNTSAVIPRAWIEALGGDREQFVVGVVAVFAYTKSDVPALLTDRGLRQVEADTIAASARYHRELPPVLRMLNDVSPVDLGVYAWIHTQDRAVIIRVDCARYDRGAVRLVARVRRTDGGTYVEAVNPDAGVCPECDSADVLTFDRAEDGVTHHVCQACGLDRPAS